MEKQDLTFTGDIEKLQSIEKIARHMGLGVILTGRNNVVVIEIRGGMNSDYKILITLAKGLGISEYKEVSNSGETTA